MDWSEGVATYNNTVWKLMYNNDNKTYNWSDKLPPALGNNNYNDDMLVGKTVPLKYFTDMWFEHLVSRSAGDPDDFLSHFG